MKQPPTVAIIGAGPGGTCCAAMLERLGVNAFILEAGSFPRFTLGESLLPISLDHLEDAGLLDAVLRMDFVRKPGAVFSDGTLTSVFDFSQTKDIRHPHAFNLRRDRFDAVLADAVEARGVAIHWNTVLTEATYAEKRWTLETAGSAGKARFEADFVVDASGAAIILRLAGFDMVEPADAGGRRGSVFCHLRDPHRPDGFDADAVWIVSGKTDAWGWIIPFSDGCASVGFVCSEHELLEAGDDADAQFAGMLASIPVAARRFPEPDVVRIAPRAVFGYQRPLNVPHGPGYCLVGNSIGFIDPIFSSGVAVATESAVRAARAIHSEFVDGEFDWSTEYAEPMMAGINVLCDCVECWYDGTLKQLIYAQEADLPYRSEITSILAGGAWDRTNPLTRDTAWSLRYLMDKLKARRRDA